jgi:hypothetical protein
MIEPDVSGFIRQYKGHVIMEELITFFLDGLTDGSQINVSRSHPARNLPPGFGIMQTEAP